MKPEAFLNLIQNTSVQAIQELEDLQQKFKDNNLIHKRGILLEGPAGNGKSSLITILIKKLIDKNGIAFIIRNFEMFNYTVNFLKNVFRKIEPNTPIITIIEDIDLFPDYALPELLDFLDGKASVDHSVCLMTTNNSSELSPALLRCSRIDRRHVLESPTSEMRKEYFKSKNVPEDLIEKYIEETEEFSFAELKELYVSTIILGNDFNETIDVLKGNIECKNYLESKNIQIAL